MIVKQGESAEEVITSHFGDIYLVKVYTDVLYKFCETRYLKRLTDFNISLSEYFLLLFCTDYCGLM